MKKFLFVLMGVFTFSGAFAAGENIPTSKSYVDSKLGEKQDIIPANDGATQVLTNTGTAGEYGTKGIYDATGAYATQTQNLVDAATMNAGVQNAIDSEFQCIEWDEHGECLLLQLGGISEIATGYTRVEYLESTGTQYICTGIPIKKTDTAKMEMNALVSGSGWMGADGFLQMALNQGYYRARTSGTPLQYVSIGNRDNIILDYDDSNTLTLYVNGEKIESINWASSQTPQTTFSFFALTHTGCNPIGGYVKAKIYSLRLFKNNSIVGNFIPARRNSDGVLGMYDTVSNTFFTNAGTGEFIAGPVVYLPHGE